MLAACSNALMHATALPRRGRSSALSEDSMTPVSTGAAAGALAACSNALMHAMALPRRGLASGLSEVDDTAASAGAAAGALADSNALMHAMVLPRRGEVGLERPGGEGAAGGKDSSAGAAAGTLSLA